MDFLKKAQQSILSSATESAPEWASAFLQKAQAFALIAIAERLDKIIDRMDRGFAQETSAQVELCPRCELPTLACICDEVPGQ